jgi:type 1 fimbriae regulatory protein FimB
MTQLGMFEGDEQGTAERRNVKRRSGHESAVDAHERGRDFLTPDEVERLLKAARGGRFGVRDYGMLLLAFRHGLRATELTTLRRKDVSLEEARIWVTRRKGGLSTSQPLAGDELRALKAYLNKRADGLPWLFLSSQGTQMSRQNFYYLVREAGERAGLGSVHPHMLRHACGHALADKGMDTRLLQDWLGHRDIRHTAWYSRTSATRFDGLWE